MLGSSDRTHVRRISILGKPFDALKRYFQLAQINFFSHQRQLAFFELQRLAVTAHLHWVRVHASRLQRSVLTLKAILLGMQFLPVKLTKLVTLAMRRTAASISTQLIILMMLAKGVLEVQNGVVVEQEEEHEEEQEE
jgi:hypothetical protein